MRRTIVVASLLVLALGLVAVARDKADEVPKGWKLVAHKLSGCSAFLPGDPKKQDSASPSVEVWLGSGDAVFSFSCRRDDDFADKTKAAKALAEEGKLEAMFSNGVVANEKELAVKGSIGKEFQILDKDSKKLKWRTRVYVVGKDMVTLSADDVASEKDVKIFFDSFKLPAK